MVVNNGRQFDFAGVESILNVGVSEKPYQENAIGKFGIGFKLAHRLVGKGNGIDELFEDYGGPIVFSWKNGEIEELKDFSKSPNLKPELQEYELIQHDEGQEGICKTEDPWPL